MVTRFMMSVGKKFHADSSVRFFPGNTIVCMLREDSEVFHRAKSMRLSLQERSIASCLAFLPDGSLHMTALEGVCDQKREVSFWTNKLPLDCSLADVDAFFQAAYAKIPPFHGVSLSFDHLWIDTAVCIALHPTTSKDEMAIRTWRDEAGDALGLHFPGHESYMFHISLAYGIKMPTEEQLLCLETIADTFQKKCQSDPFSFIVPPPQLTFFDNMLCFHPSPIERRS